MNWYSKYKYVVEKFMDGGMSPKAFTNRVSFEKEKDRLKKEGFFVAPKALGNEFEATRTHSRFNTSGDYVPTEAQNKSELQRCGPYTKKAILSIDEYVELYTQSLKKPPTGMTEAKEKGYKFVEVLYAVNRPDVYTAIKDRCFHGLVNLIEKAKGVYETPVKPKKKPHQTGQIIKLVATVNTRTYGAKDRVVNTQLKYRIHIALEENASVSIKHIQENISNAPGSAGKTVPGADFSIDIPGVHYFSELDEVVKEYLVNYIKANESKYAEMLTQLGGQNYEQIIEEDDKQKLLRPMQVPKSSVPKVIQ